VYRSPISGIIRGARYEPGKFLSAMNPGSAEHNERNTVTIEGEGHHIIFKQIAGLLARRIVFTKTIGDTVRRGERVGLIKFGSRTDVLLDASAEIAVQVGDNVKGGTSILAFLEPKETELAGASGREQRRKS
jgi:phosphatidylserine decarboxylase